MGDENKDLSISSFARQSRPKAFDFGDADATATPKTPEVKADVTTTATDKDAKPKSITEKVTEVATYTPAYMSPLERDEAYEQMLKDLYTLRPEDTYLQAYIERASKPKPIDEKKAKRARLFGGIGDALMTLADGITLSKGGLVGKRDSALANANKVIEAQRALNAKQLLEYNKGYNEALRATSKQAEALNKQYATKVTEYERDLRKSQQDAEKFNAQQTNKLRELLGRSAVSAELANYRKDASDKQLELRLKYRQQNSGSGRGGQGGGLSAVGANEYTMFMPDVNGNYHQFDLSKISNGTKYAGSGLMQAIIDVAIKKGKASSNSMAREDAEDMDVWVNGSITTNQLTGEQNVVKPMEANSQNYARWITKNVWLSLPSDTDPTKTNFEVELEKLTKK